MQQSFSKDVLFSNALTVNFLRECILRVITRSFHFCTQRTGFKDLVLDKELTHGQVRKVDQDWVDKLAADFEANRPEELVLTVWKEQGMFM